MARTANLFERPKVMRRVLMHVYDASGECCGDDGDPAIVVMRCARCGHKTDWISVGVSQAKRGIPCPQCSPLPQPGQTGDKP